MVSCLWPRYNTRILLGSFQNLLTNSLTCRSITKLQTGCAINVRPGSINPARTNLPNCLSDAFRLCSYALYIFHGFVSTKQRDFDECLVNVSFSAWSIANIRFFPHAVKSITCSYWRRQTAFMILLYAMCLCNVISLRNWLDWKSELNLTQYFDISLIYWRSISSRSHLFPIIVRILFCNLNNFISWTGYSRTAEVISVLVDAPCIQESRSINFTMNMTFLKTIQGVSDLFVFHNRVHLRILKTQIFSWARWNVEFLGHYLRIIFRYIIGRA